MFLRCEDFGVSNFLSQNSYRKKMFDLLLNCASTAVLIPTSGDQSFYVTCKCPLIDEACIEEIGVCKILSAALSNKPAVTFCKSDVFLNVDHEAFSTTCQGVMEKVRNGVTNRFQTLDIDFLRYMLETVGPLKILVEAYEYLKQGAEIKVYWNETFPQSLATYLCQIAERIQFSGGKAFSPYFKLDNISLEDISSRNSHSKTRADFIRRPLKREWENLTFPFAEFCDPLDSGLELLNSAKIDKKELRCGLRDYGDASFYLRQLAMSAEIDQECLQMVLRKIKIANNRLQCARLCHRLHWIQEKNPHLSLLISQLIQYVDDFCEDPRRSPYIFQAFEFPNSKSSNLKPSSANRNFGMDEQAEMSHSSEQKRAAVAKRNSWPFQVVLDSSCWYLAQVFTCHGFNCTLVKGLYSGEISDDDVELAKRLQAIIVIAKGQRRKLIEKFDGLRVISGNMRRVLNRCLTVSLN
eukprot:Gregarina_sp_Poly_1__4896@NODE_25_length_19863_cov_179_262730_g23_i0_p5_GENE_NODE_25_length_19863_cov_179_262730_g23_i0NODE_25_length_19863_cov_179_262730_g23_i0_p5_ORF_typecomplete_len466_score52_26IL32/PF15225_6/5_6e03IL32/PF15225_6/0_38_NODE_25_length_19863_cov_179_262730_g23_i01559616993